MTAQPATSLASAVTRPRVIVALQEWADRDRLARVIERARPHYAAIEVAPTDLSLVVPAFNPGFVICSDTSDVIERHAQAILVLDVRPDGVPWAAVFCRDGTPQLIRTPGTAEILQLLDKEFRG